LSYEFGTINRTFTILPAYLGFILGLGRGTVYINALVICRTVLHNTHFSVFFANHPEHADTVRRIWSICAFDQMPCAFDETRYAFGQR